MALTYSLYFFGIVAVFVSLISHMQLEDVKRNELVLKGTFTLKVERLLYAMFGLLFFALSIVIQ